MATKHSFNITKGVTNDILFEIDQEDLTGTWLIEMALNNVVEKFKFNVKSSETSIADIALIAPRYNTYTDTKVNLKIDSDYKFGQTVTGLADIDIARITECNKNIPAENVTHITTQIQYTKGSVFNFNIQDLKPYNPKCDDLVQLSVRVHDNVTNQKYSEMIKINFVQNNVKVRFANKNEKIKPGIKFRAIVEFSYLGEKEFDFQDFGDKIQYSHVKNDKLQTIPFSIINSKNTIFFDYLTEPDTMNITLAVKLAGQEIASHVFPSMAACAKTMISVIYQEPLKQLKVGDVTSLIVSSNEAINMLKYYFIVDGRIENASSVIYPAPATLVNFQLSITKNIVPRSKLVVYFYSPTTHSVAEDYVDIVNPDFSQNYVHISAKNVQAYNFNLTQMMIETQPNSNILLHAFNEENLNQLRNFSLIESQLKQKWDKMKDYYNQDDPISSKLITFSNAQVFCQQPYQLEIEQDDASQFDDYYDENDQGVNHKETWIWDKYSSYENSLIK